MAEAIVISAVIGGLTNLLTNRIEPLLHSTGRSAVEVCRKLESSVKYIKRDVEHVKRQFEELQRHDPNAWQDLPVMQNLVERLAEELHLADLDVHEFNSAGKVAKKLAPGRRLSKKITERNNEITMLGGQLASANSHLTILIKNARRPSFDGQPQNPPMNQISLQQPHHPPTDLSWQLHQPSAPELQADVHSASLHRWESGNLIHSSYDGGSSSHGSPVHADIQRQHSFQVNQYTNHTEHNPHRSQIHRSNTIASTYQRPVDDVPHHHRSSTLPRLEVSYPDPFIPHMFLKP